MSYAKAKVRGLCLPSPVLATSFYSACLQRNGVQVISVTEPFEDTPTGRLLEAMIESLDEFYSANLGEEVTRGMRESASRGFYLPSSAPYGYRKVKVKDSDKERPRLELEPNQAVVVEEKGEKTQHTVSLDDDYYHLLTQGKIGKEELIRKSFQFLLEREPKESILSNFNLKVIKVYFPEFEKEIRRV